MGLTEPPLLQSLQPPTSDSCPGASTLDMFPRMPGDRMRAESGESKKEVQCGICGHKGRRDNLKSTHFPRKHPGKLYFEMKEKPLSQFFTSTSKELEENDVTMEDAAVPEVAEKEVEVETSTEHVSIQVPEDFKTQIVEAIEPMLQRNLEDIVVNEFKKMTVKNGDQEKLRKDDKSSEENIVILQIKSCRNVQDLCTSAGLSLFRSEKLLVCDVCDDHSDSYTRKAGEFSYDFEAVGIDFTEKNLPEKFRNLKKNIVHHIGTKNHKEADNSKKEQDKTEIKYQLFNYKAGIKLGKMVYSNVKERTSYAKYERDVANAASLGEEIGNINHGQVFAQNLTDAMGVEARIELTKYFNKILPCTGEKPPVSFSSDKMTMKHKTGHIAGVITPDVDAPLAGPLMKPVFLAMPVTRAHDGHGLAEQILSILDGYIDDVVEQVQTFNHDGQYVHLNIKKHIMEIRRGFVDKSEWMFFSHDPAHRINLGSNDASKDNRDGSRKAGSLQETFELVQKINKHVTYGKHNLELEALLEDIGITTQNKPLKFSDTRFPQYAYFVLRNFTNTYPALMKQMEYEINYTENKAEELVETLEKATSVEFVVTVAGATDIYLEDNKSCPNSLRRLINL